MSVYLSYFFFKIQIFHCENGMCSFFKIHSAMQLLGLGESLGALSDPSTIKVGALICVVLAFDPSPVGLSPSGGEIFSDRRRVEQERPEVQRVKTELQ